MLRIAAGTMQTVLTAYITTSSKTPQNPRAYMRPSTNAIQCVSCPVTVHAMSGTVIMAATIIMIGRCQRFILQKAFLLTLNGATYYSCT
jgi:hypothetical protein